jgi:hypothetical protein
MYISSSSEQLKLIEKYCRHFSMYVFVLEELLYTRYKGLFAMQKRVLFCTLSSALQTHPHTQARLSISLSASDGCMGEREPRFDSRREKGSQASAASTAKENLLLNILHNARNLCRSQHTYAAANSLRRRTLCRVLRKKTNQ